MSPLADVLDEGSPGLESSGACVECGKPACSRFGTPGIDERPAARLESFRDSVPAECPKSLRDLGLGSAIRLSGSQWPQVLAEPKRAAAWLWAIRYDEAENPAGLFWAKFSAGGWPPEYVEAGEDHEPRSVSEAVRVAYEALRPP